MTVELLTEHLLEFLSLIGGCRGSSESTFFKIPHCWKSHVTAQMLFLLSFCASNSIGQVLRTHATKYKSMHSIENTSMWEVFSSKHVRP